MRADQIKTEAVNRADLRASDRQELGMKTAVSGIFCKLPFQCAADTRFEFCSRRFRKGHNKHRGQIEGVVVIQYTREDPLGQHRGFAGSCRR